MKIEKWCKIDTQEITLGKCTWSVARLIELSKDFKVFDAPLDCMDVSEPYKNMRPREFVMHMKAVLDADLSYPIILDEDGELMDGRHRIMKAMYLGHKMIKAVRFERNPDACRYKEG